MGSHTVHLHKATDATDSFAICMAGKHGTWLAQHGFGQNFEKVWSVEMQSATNPPATLEIDWNSVLDSAITAYDMSDPVLADFEWPRRARV